MIDVTAILLAHDEGDVLVDRALKSLVRSVEYAKKAKIAVEILVILDRPNQETAGYFKTTSIPGLKTILVDCGDPGLSRNYGVKAAEGRYVTFLDGDNLISELWIARAYTYLEASFPNLVAHPEYHIFFDQRNFTMQQTCSDSPSFKTVNLLMTNFWDTVAMARKDIYLQHPFVETISRVGLGYEDWHFDCETISYGIAHHIVPDTVHFMRSKEVGSVCKDSIGSHRLLPPTRLFQPSFYKKKYEQAISPAAANVISAPAQFDISSFKHQLKQFLKSVIPKITETGINGTINNLTKSIPGEVQDELRAIRELEPLVTVASIADLCSHQFIDNSVYTAAYNALCCSVAGNANVFVMLICNSSINFKSQIEHAIHDLAERYNCSTIVIIDTSSGSGYKTDLHAGHGITVTVVALDESQFNDQLSMLIALFILNAQPEAVYLMNSPAASDIYERYGKTIQVRIPVDYFEPANNTDRAVA